jgi:hypothetical protein
MTLKFGASGFNEGNLKIQESGQLWFAQALEKRSDGALKIEFIGSNAICNQLDCVKKTQQGIVDLFTASTQNSAGSAPYYNVLDFAYMFPSGRRSTTSCTARRARSCCASRCASAAQHPVPVQPLRVARPDAGQEVRRQARRSPASTSSPAPRTASPAPSSAASR